MSNDFQGMTLRDYFAAHAPVELGTVLKVYGDENADLFLDNVRASYMAILAMVRYEYADAMLTEREKRRQVEVVAGKECADLIRKRGEDENIH